MTVTPGLYRIGIYVYENDEIYGICWMPVCIKKTFWGGSEIYYGEQVPNFEDVQESDSAKGTVLATWGMEDYFYIPGYAYDTQFGPNNQNVYIEADSADGSRMTYLALPSDSTGNSFYPDETYTDNSFVARIPMDLMPEGKIKLRVILENRETKERIYAFQDIYQIEEGQAHVYRGEVVDNLKEFTISQTAQATVLNIFDSGDYYYIPGYAYDTEVGPNRQSVYVEFIGENGEKLTVRAMNTDSTGLDYFPSTDYTQNSFSAYMPKQLVQNGRYYVRV